MIVPGRAVVVPERVAAMLAGPLRRAVDDARRRDRGHVAPEVVEVLAELEAMAKAVTARDDRQGFGSETRVARASFAPASSEVMTVSEVADLIGTTQQNVRARARSATSGLVGRKLDGNGWVFTQAAVEEYIAHRMENT